MSFVINAIVQDVEILFLGLVNNKQPMEIMSGISEILDGLAIHFKSWVRFLILIFTNTKLFCGQCFLPVKICVMRTISSWRTPRFPSNGCINIYMHSKYP